MGNIVSIDYDEFEKQLDVGSRSIAKSVMDIVKLKWTPDLLDESCQYIEMFLKNAEVLPTRMGMKQFYDTESAMAKRSRSVKKHPFGKDWEHSDEPHLIEQWHVSWAKRGDSFVIVIENDKYVKGRGRNWSLFELLWYGTDTYVVPAQLAPHEAEQLKASGRRNLEQYKRRMLLEPQRIGLPYVRKMRPRTYKERGEKAAIVGLESRGKAPVRKEIVYDIDWNREQKFDIGAKKMSFYNRFQGRFYFNQFMRQGIKGQVVEDFHDYIADCIVRGLRMGAGSTINISRGKDWMKKAFKKVGLKK
jgi:hypothetical protein